jgi:HAD superfamily hydrolase (TIGR01509 family)
VDIKAVIFDCDGTLVDSVSLQDEVLLCYLAELGFELTALEASAWFGSGRLADSVAAFERHFGCTLPEHFADQLRQRRGTLFRKRLRPVPGAEEILEYLAVPCAVASNAPRDLTELSLELTGLLKYFPGRVFSAYDVSAWKPNPDLFLKVATQLDVHPQHCAVVEDSLHGINAGVAAGMQVFALQREHKVDTPSGVEHITTLTELRRHLRDSEQQPQTSRYPKTKTYEG